MIDARYANGAFIRGIALRSEGGELVVSVYDHQEQGWRDVLRAPRELVGALGVDVLGHPLHEIETDRSMES